VTIAIRPCCGVGRHRFVEMICPTGEAKYFSDRGWTLICPTGCFATFLRIRALPSSVVDLHPRCSRIWQCRERVDEGDTRGLEVPEVTGQNGQPVMLSCSGDDDVGKSRCLAETSRPIRVPPLPYRKQAPDCRRDISPKMTTVSRCVIPDMPTRVGVGFIRGIRIHASW
jgi:hypothetical protein